MRPSYTRPSRKLLKFALLSQAPLDRRPPIVATTATKPADTGAAPRPDLADVPAERDSIDPKS